MKRLLTLCLILCAFLYAIEAQADSPRKVVVEEFTNTGCGPCASANPAFHQYIEDNFTKVIPVIFHADWPGTDPYNDYNPDMVTYRLRTHYASYAINGVPHAVVAGTTRGLPNVAGSEWPAMKTAIETKSAETSPIDITVTLEKGGPNGKAGVKILSSQAYNNVDLFVVVMTYVSFFDAANGEKEFKWIPRRVLPADAGETINLAVGTELNKSYNFAWDTDWEEGSIYIVAFVQNKTTKEIYQGATSPYNMPTVAVATVQAITSPYQKIAYGGTFNQDIVVTNPNTFTTTMTPTVNAEALPAGWTVSFEPTNAILEAGSSKTFVATVTNPSQYGLVTPQIVVTPSAEGVGVSAKGEVAFMLLVTGTKYAYYMDYMNNANTAATYDAIANSKVIDGNFALINMGTSHAALINAYPPQDFHTAIFSYDYFNTAYAYTFSTSKYYSYLGQGQLSAIEKMISNGKNVVIMSEMDLSMAENATNGSAQGKSFFSNIGIGADGAYTLRVTVNAQSQITGSIPYDMAGNYPDGTPLVLTGKMNSKYDTSWPFYNVATDQIKINDQTITPILTYAGGKIGGIHKKVMNSNIVYTTCNLSGCPTNADRVTLLDFLLDWTTKAQAVNDDNNTFNMQVSPNPIAVSSELTYTITDLSNVSINLVDLLGNNVRELTTGFVSAGNHSVNLNAQGLASGTYYIVANINGTTSTIPVVINK
jgi:hypothetical protein